MTKVREEMKGRMGIWGDLRAIFVFLFLEFGFSAAGRESMCMLNYENAHIGLWKLLFNLDLTRELGDWAVFDWQ